MIGRDGPLALGSASPRRRELLALLRIPWVLVEASVDERKIEGERVSQYLERVVEAKLAVARGAAQSVVCAGVLVADTIVVRDGQVLGKPASHDDAYAMLTGLSGREHEVCTRFAVAARDGNVHAQTVSTRVAFRALTALEIERYVASGEGRDKAGGYAIQGLGSFAVTHVVGSYANVVGLPVCEVVLALRSLGLLGDFP